MMMTGSETTYTQMACNEMGILKSDGGKCGDSDKPHGSQATNQPLGKRQLQSQLNCCLGARRAHPTRTHVPPPVTHVAGAGDKL